MILNRLIFPEGNRIRFCLSHSEDGKEYENSEDEYYYINISDAEDPSVVQMNWQSYDKYFDFDAKLSEGRYVFEVGLQKADGKRVVILPAFDERRHPLNEILILKRLGI